MAYPFLRRVTLAGAFMLPAVTHAQSSDPKVVAKAEEARNAYRRQEYKACSRLFAEAIRMGAGAALTHYDYACCLALSGDTALALTHLSLAADKGYRDLAHVAADADLAALCAQPRYKSFVKKIETAQEAYFQTLGYPGMARRLQTIYVTDQELRSKMSEPMRKNDTVTVRRLFREQKPIDEANLAEIEAMIAKLGRWPGYKEVGLEGSNTVWLVIQHSGLAIQEKYLPILETAVLDKNASSTNLAYLQDRILMFQDKPQIYGTQFKQNRDTGKIELAPLQDPDHVDERRARIGLGTLADAKRQMGIED